LTTTKNGEGEGMQRADKWLGSATHLGILVLGAAGSLAAWGLALLPQPAPAARAARYEASPSASREPLDTGTVSLGLMAFITLDQAKGDISHRHDAARAIGLLREAQWNEARGCIPSELNHGGTGRSPSALPDLEHTARALLALRAGGVAADDPYVRRALRFISRCQDLSGPAPHGFAHRPAIEAHDQGPYGLTTCMAVSSLLAAGIPPEDPRVASAFQWLEEHYTLDVHPGMARPREGLFSYYYEFAKAMNALGRNQIRDVHGVSRNWRAELGKRLAEQQAPDGSWNNPEETSQPGGCRPAVVTSFATLTLCQLRD
jgi:squalene-hopene/tetraprenyl-beta-curcumene cyclase